VVILCNSHTISEEHVVVEKCLHDVSLSYADLRREKWKTSDFLFIFAVVVRKSLLLGRRNFLLVQTCLSGKLRN
jgi:hypothetical protein